MFIKPTDYVPLCRNSNQNEISIVSDYVPYDIPEYKIVVLGDGGVGVCFSFFVVSNPTLYTYKNKLICNKQKEINAHQSIIKRYLFGRIWYA